MVISTSASVIYAVKMIKNLFSGSILFVQAVMFELCE